MVEPVDIDPIHRDEIGEEDDVWGDDLIKIWKMLLLRNMVTLLLKEIK